MPVITVAGSLGGSAREIAQAIAVDLGLEYIDHQILVEAAQELGVSVAAVERRDERASSISERIAGVMRNLMERSAVAGAADPMSGGGMEMVFSRTYAEAAELPSAGGGPLDDERYLKTLTSVVKGLAKRGNVVLLGRGSQAILHDAPETLHVYIFEPREQRVALTMEREGITQQEADQQIAKRDQSRVDYYRRYFKVDVGHPNLYDIVINTGRLSQEAAVKLVRLAASEKLPRPG